MNLRQFASDFLLGLSNDKGGLSLKKLLATGFFWLVVSLCLKYTDANNLVSVITVLAGLILTLMGINQWGKQKMKEIEIKEEVQEELTDEQPK